MINTLINDPYFSNLKTYLIEETGLAFYQHRNDILANRCIKHMKQYNLPNCKVLLEHLKKQVKQRDVLIANLTVGETFFFRHTEFFNALRNVVLPDIITRNRIKKTLNIWSAGCATGPEPYSISIMLKKDFGNMLKDWKINITGTDINRQFIVEATTGIYRKWALRDLSEDELSRYFTPHHTESSWSLKSEYRQNVSFQYHNLAQQPFTLPSESIPFFDLILCRNVIIYFNRRITKDIIQKFHQNLTDGGWLGVGHAEPNQKDFQQFKTIQAPGVTLYKKEDNSTHTQPKTWSPPKLPQRSIVPQSCNNTLSHPNLKTNGSNKKKNKSTNKITLKSVRKLADQGAYNQANKNIQILLKTNPLDPILHFYHALILSNQNHLDLAIYALKQAIYLNTSFAMAYYHLGFLEQQKGHTDLSYRAWENARKIAQSNQPNDKLEASDGLQAAELISLIDLHISTRTNPCPPKNT